MTVLTEDVMKRWSIDNEHCEACAAKNTRVIVVVPHHLLTERRLELGLDGEHLQSRSQLNVKDSRRRASSIRTHVKALIEKNA
jgi:hypothetical protein